jgi:hypothetical protein
VPALAATLVLILSGCQKYGQQEAGISGGGKTADPSGKPKEGYTPEEKTYFTDIQKQKAYETHLAPIFEKLNAVSWGAAIKSKKWLLVPQDLNADDTRNMAVTFPEGEEKALAVQTSNDIRVQKKIFEALSSEAQADFLLSEILTSIFLYRNLNDTELCAAVRAGYKDITCPFLRRIVQTSDIDDGLDQSGEVEVEKSTNAFQADQDNSEVQEAVRKNRFNQEQKKKEPVNDPRFGKKVKLTRAEYHKIELLVDFVGENVANLDQDTLVKKMTALGFDTRIFQIKIP